MTSDKNSIIHQNSTIDKTSTTHQTSVKDICNFFSCPDKKTTEEHVATVDQNTTEDQNTNNKRKHLVETPCLSKKSRMSNFQTELNVQSPSYSEKNSLKDQSTSEDQNSNNNQNLAIGLTLVSQPVPQNYVEPDNIGGNKSCEIIQQEANKCKNIQADVKKEKEYSAVKSIQIPNLEVKANGDRDFCKKEFDVIPKVLH